MKGTPEPSSTPPCSSHPGSSPGLIGASGIIPWTSPPSSAPLHVPHTFINRASGCPVCRHSPQHLLSPSKTGEIFVSAKKNQLMITLKGIRQVWHHMNKFSITSTSCTPFLWLLQAPVGAHPALGVGFRATLAPAGAESARLALQSGFHRNRWIAHRS